MWLPNFLDHIYVIMLKFLCLSVHYWGFGKGTWDSKGLIKELPLSAGQSSDRQTSIYIWVSVEIQLQSFLDGKDS